MTAEPVRIGVVGAGLMGKELAGVCGRWSQLVDHPSAPQVVAVADPNRSARDWFRQVPTVETFADDWRALVDDDSLDVLYLAVPHNLHEELYIAAADAGRDFLAEKPFGIDLHAAERIVAAIDASPSFVRVSSEFPFYPGALKAYAYARSGALGEVLDVRSAFQHSSDIDRGKAINWKRRVETCGEIGVMGDLGLHVAHIPLRLGFRPESVYGLLDNVVTERPGPDGSMVACDTWDNALLACRVPTDRDRSFTMLWETRRIAPGQMNSWSFEALGMDGGVRFSTRNPAVVQRFSIKDGEQVWEDVQPGHASAWPSITGGIFEFGFGDALLQMWASYLAERAGSLGDRFGTVTPGEALDAHRVFAAAVRSQESGRAEMPRA
ncbi:MAG: gfo/Idh/MocA family oxidoreductase [Actinomycetales bacterium]|nr:gfo/Idh/MocA family oxidoreductase [Actinomycetales bacterium]